MKTTVLAVFVAVVGSLVCGNAEWEPPCTRSGRKYGCNREEHVLQLLDAAEAQGYNMTVADIEDHHGFTEEDLANMEEVEVDEELGGIAWRAPTRYGEEKVRKRQVAGKTKKEKHQRVVRRKVRGKVAKVAQEDLTDAKDDDFFDDDSFDEMHFRSPLNQSCQQIYFCFLETKRQQICFCFLQTKCQQICFSFLQTKRHSYVLLQ